MLEIKTGLRVKYLFLLVVYQVSINKFKSSRKSTLINWLKIPVRMKSRYFVILCLCIDRRQNNVMSVCRFPNEMDNYYYYRRCLR